MSLIDAARRRRGYNTDDENENSAVIEQNNPIIQSRPIEALNNNPFQTAIEERVRQNRQAKFDEGTRNAEASIAESEHVSLWEIAKGVPKAAFDITQNTIQHPVQTGQAVLGGLVDAGPTILNGLHNIGSGILTAVYGKGKAPKPLAMPKPGQTMLEYIGNNSDISVALQEGATQTSAYMIGQGAVNKFAGLSGAPQVIFGDVMGGQLATEEGSLVDRGKQALFDTAFGVFEVGAGMGINRLRGRANVPDVTGVAVNNIDNSIAETISQQAKNSLDNSSSGVREKSIEWYMEDPQRIANKTVEIKEIDGEISIVDGRHALQASLVTGTPPKFKDVTGNYIDVDSATIRELLGETQTPKSVEDYIASQKVIFRGDNTTEKRFSDLGMPATTSRQVAERYASQYGQDALVNEFYLPPDARILDAGNLTDEMKASMRSRNYNPDNPKDIVEWADDVFSHELDADYDAVDLSKFGGESEIRVLNESILKTRDELVADFNNNIGLKEGDALAGGTVTKIEDGGQVPPQDKFDVTTPTATNTTSKTAYVAKQGLGNDGLGNPVWARAEVDNKTGNAIVYYDERLDLPGNEINKQVILDHEFGHILDKRLNGGTNLSAELGNFDGNAITLNKALEKFSAQIGETVESVVTKLDSELKIVDPRARNEAERFANAFSKFQQDPKAVGAQAPTFARLMEFTPVEGRYSTSRGTTASQINRANEELSVPLGQNVESPTQSNRSSLTGKTGLDTGKRITDRPSFNPKSYNTTKEVQELFKNINEQPGINNKRIRKSNQDVQDLAMMVGMTEKELLNVKAGSVMNRETLFAARMLVGDKMQDLVNLNKGINPKNVTLEQASQIRDSFERLVAMQQSVTGVVSETAGTLGSLNKPVTPGEYATIRELMEMVQTTPGFNEGDVMKFAKAFGLKQREISTREIWGKRGFDLWYAAILSGPKTTLRNLLGTGFNQFTEMISKLGNPKTMKEFIPGISGWLRGWNEGFAEAYEVFQKGGYQGKFMEANKNIGDELVDNIVYPPGPWKKYQHIVESVGRFLAAQDKAFSTAGRRMEEASLAVRGEAVSAEVAEAVTKAYGEASVYHGVPRGRSVRAMAEGIQRMRKILPESKIIIPFVQTVANVLDRQLDYFPITSMLRLQPRVLKEQAERIVKEFNLSETDVPFIQKRLKDQQVGRMVIGGSIMTAASILAGQGRISGGGPSNYNERLQLQRTGWRPNSIKVGDYWVPYTYLGPLNGVLSAVGNMYDKTIYDKADNETILGLMGKGLIGWGQTQLDASFLSGVSDLLDVLSERTPADQYFTNLGASLIPIPALYSQTKDMIWRQQYETRDIVSKLRQKLGLTGDAFGLDPLNPRLDAFGEQMTSDLIYGVTPKKYQADEVDNLLIANDVVVTLPQRNRSYTDHQGVERRLTDDEYQNYIQISGEMIYEELQRALPSLYNMDQNQLDNFVSEIQRNARDEARARIFSGNI